MSSIFTSFNKPREKSVRGTPDDMAYNMAIDACEIVKAFRARAREAELKAEEPLTATPVENEAYEVLQALMQGRHRPVVAPVILEHFPELAVGPQSGSVN